MRSPIAVDFFAGSGGASLGLKRAGFFVIGVDIRKPSAYYGDRFIQADLREGCPVDVARADFLFASPPCQAFSVANCLSAAARASRYENLIPLARNLLAGHPFSCIENVPTAPLRQDLLLQGQHFGLNRLRRVRAFELSFFCLGFSPIGYTRETVPVTRGTPSNEYKRRKKKGLHPVVSVQEKLDVMGLSKYPMLNLEVANAVPPAYAEYIGRQALAQMGR